MKMDELIADFTSHLREALEIGEAAKLKPANREIKNVLITGLGGSGIGGKIVSQLVAKECIVPIVTNNDYNIPGWVGQETLVIVSSYSGNTEETVVAMNHALGAGAEVCCISTGGQVIDIAKEEELNHILVTGGMPPRAAFGYSFTQQFFVLHHYGLIGSEFKDQVAKGIELLDAEEETLRTAAKDLATKLKDKIPIIYTEASFEGVGVRFRQQLNENSKLLCWHHVLPEMNHNELVGWHSGTNDHAVVIFRNNNDHDRTQKRIDICKPIFARATNTIEEVWSKGDSAIERALYLIHLGDWVSWFLSELNDVDAMEIANIDHLKYELAKF